MRSLAAFVVWVLFSGCSAGNFAPVVDIYGQEPKPRKVTSGTHHVREGETLYSIAWRYGWDFRALARANNIPAPYTIYPGQRISMALKAPDSGVASKPNTSSSKPASKPSVSKPTSKPTPKPAPSSKTPVGLVEWRWPASGQVVESFSSASQGRKGIAISGRLNSPVVAAASGRVVRSEEHTSELQSPA